MYYLLLTENQQLIAFSSYLSTSFEQKVYAKKFKGKTTLSSLVDNELVLVSNSKQLISHRIVVF